MFVARNEHRAVGAQFPRRPAIEAELVRADLEYPPAGRQLDDDDPRPSLVDREGGEATGVVEFRCGVENLRLDQGHFAVDQIDQLERTQWIDLGAFPRARAVDRWPHLHDRCG